MHSLMKPYGCNLRLVAKTRKEKYQRQQEAVPDPFIKMHGSGFSTGSDSDIMSTFSTIFSSIYEEKNLH